MAGKPVEHDTDPQTPSARNAHGLAQAAASKATSGTDPGLGPGVRSPSTPPPPSARSRGIVVPPAQAPGSGASTRDLPAMPMEHDPSASGERPTAAAVVARQKAPTLPEPLSRSATPAVTPPGPPVILAQNDSVDMLLEGIAAKNPPPQRKRVDSVPAQGPSPASAAYVGAVHAPAAAVSVVHEPSVIVNGPTLPSAEQLPTMRIERHVVRETLATIPAHAERTADNTTFVTDPPSTARRNMLALVMGLCVVIFMLLGVWWRNQQLDARATNVAVMPASPPLEPLPDDRIPPAMRAEEEAIIVRSPPPPPATVAAVTAPSAPKSSAPRVVAASPMKNVPSAPPSAPLSKPSPTAAAAPKASSRSVASAKGDPLPQDLLEDTIKH